MNDEGTCGDHSGDPGPHDQRQDGDAETRKNDKNPEVIDDIIFAVKGTQEADQCNNQKNECTQPEANVEQLCKHAIMIQLT